MNLLVDIGNSRLKWALENDGHIGDVLAMDYRQSDFRDRLCLGWQSLAPPNAVAIASVSARQVLKTVIELTQTLWPDVAVLVPQSSNQAFGVSSAYDHPEKLGVDRWLAMIGAYRHYPGNLCVVDCGTAITIDVLQADGKHLGGVIVPGLSLMKKALISDTADLRFVALAHHIELATETSVAIANGALMAAAGLIEYAAQRFSSGYQLIVTGGDAEIVVASLSIPAVADDKLVLKGLMVFCSGKQIL